MVDRKGYNARYYQEHKAEIAERKRRHYETHKEEILARNRKWMENNKEHWNEYMRKRREKLKGVDTKDDI